MIRIEIFSCALLLLLSFPFFSYLFSFFFGLKKVHAPSYFTLVCVLRIGNLLWHLKWPHVPIFFPILSPIFSCASLFSRSFPLNPSNSLYSLYKLNITQHKSTQINFIDHAGCGWMWNDVFVGQVTSLVSVMISVSRSGSGT